MAAGFAVMGAFVIYLANTGRMASGPGFQVAIGRGLSRVFQRIEAWTAPVPEALLGLAVLALAGVFVYATLRDRRRPPAVPATHACHGDDAEQRPSPATPGRAQP